jgi:Domain of unknown function (DUF1996)
MIAGNTNQRNFTYVVPDIQKSLWYQSPYNTQAFKEQAAIGFNCLNYQKTPEGSLYRHFMPDKAYLDANCADGLRLELMFPSCWDGIAFEVKDQKEHLVYPELVMTGDCPQGFETRLPSLFYETIWNTNEFNGQTGQFVLSNGDPTGTYSHSLSLCRTIADLPSRLWLPWRLHDGLGRDFPPRCGQPMHQSLWPDSRLPLVHDH